MNLRFENISKSYGKKLVLQNLSFEFSKGNNYCLLGVNGAGKTTLLNLILQFFPADSGKIYFEGVHYKNLPQSVRQGIGFLSENLDLIDELSFIQYLRLVGKLYKVDSKTLEKRIKEICAYLFEEDVDLNKKSLSVFSSGMRKKVAMCASLIHIPELLILDEPFSNLDPISANNVVDLINSYKDEKRTIIFSSHNLDYIEKINPVILVIDNKKIVFDGSLETFTNSRKDKIDEALFKTLNVESKNHTIKWI